jgi:hypothetical protein
VEKDIAPKSKFPFLWIIAASLLLGAFFGLQLSWAGIKNNDGAVFWYRIGNSETGPVAYNYGIVILDLLVWTSACVTLAFLVLSILMWLIWAFKSK